MKVLVVIALISAVLSGWLGDRLRGETQFQEQLSLPPNADFFEQWNFGLGEAMAKGYWLRMLATIGGWMIGDRAYHRPGAVFEIFGDPERRQWMVQYLDGITRLAPRFDEPYLYAGIMFYWYGRSHQDAMGFLERGWREGIDRWEIPFYLGVFAHRNQEPEVAAEWMEHAARHPKAPPIVPAVAGTFGLRAGTPESGIAILEAALETVPEGHPFRDAIEQDLLMQRQLLYLNAAAEAYREQLGRSPHLLHQLVREGFITEKEMEPVAGGTFIFSGSRVVWAE